MTTQENIHSDQDEPFDGIKENRENKPPSYFNILYYGLIIWGVLFMGYFLLSGWSSDSELTDKLPAPQQTYSQGMQGGK